MRVSKFFLIIIVSVIIILCLIIFLTSSDKEVCLDTRVCKAGLELNTGKGMIIVNQQTCIENGGIWNNEKNVCKFK